MHRYHLTFPDGSSCLCLVMEPTTPAEDEAGIRSIFHAGQQMTVERFIPAIPEKLPWRRDGQTWRLGRFVLTKLDSGLLRVEWPGGQAEGGKDEIKDTVRRNWSEGI